MGDRLFKVTFEGRLQEGFSREQAEANVSRLFRLPPGKAEQLLSGPPVVIRKGVGLAEAEKYKTALEHAGMVCSIDSASPGRQEQETTRLADAPTVKEEAPPLPPDVKQICPKCGHEMPEEDFSGECLKCGIIISKYLRMLQEKGFKPAADDPAATDPARQAEREEETVRTWFPEPGLWESLFGLAQTLPTSVSLPKDKSRHTTAPLRRRFYAGLASIGILTWTVALLQMPILIILFLLDLIGSLPRFTIEEAKAIRALLALPASIYLFIILPLKWHGQTYGQRLMGLWIAPRDESYVWPSLPRILVRYFINIVNYVSVGILNLIWYMAKGKSLSDALSGTTQYEAQTLPHKPLITALKPISYAFGLVLVLIVPMLLFTIYSMNASKRDTLAQQAQKAPTQEYKLVGPGVYAKVRPSREMALSRSVSPRSVLENLAGMQKRYREEHGQYCRDMEKLLAMYGAESFPPHDPLFRMPQSNSLLMSVRENGFEIRLKREKRWYVISETGYLGDRPVL